MTSVRFVHTPQHPSFNFSSALSSNSEGYIDSSDEEEPIFPSPTSPQMHTRFGSRSHSQKIPAPKLPPIPLRSSKRSASNDSSSGSGVKYPFVKAFMVAAQKLLQQSRRQKKSPVPPPSPMKAQPVEGWTTEANVSDYEESSDGDDPQDTTEHIVQSMDDQLQRLYRPHGRWAAYFNQPIENAKVVANLGEGAMCEVYLKSGILGGQHITYISKTWVLSRTWNGFFSEIALYADPRYLRDLQGDVVPHLIGVYLVEGRVSVAMELPSSAFWVEASEDMPNHLKEKCIAAFDKIHARGVLHNDVELRHMLINAEGSVTIIDFQNSQAVTSDEACLIEPCTEDDIRLEKRKVKFKLKYQNAARYENTKRVRVLSREDRNMKRRELHALKGDGEPDCAMEAHDPDDIINPIVEPQVWTDLWLGQDSEPQCFVVPGQDYESIQYQLRLFVWTHCIRDQGPPPPPPKRRRVDRRGRIVYSAASEAGNTGKRKFSESAPSIASVTSTYSPLPTKKCRVISSVAVTSSSNEQSPPRPVPAPVPTAETYRPLTNAALRSYCLAAKGLKKELQHTPVPDLPDLNAGCFEEQSISALSRNDELSPTERPRIPLGSPSQPSPSSSQASYDAFPARPDFIHVPYEGYDRPGGFVTPNNLTESQLSLQRRTWIRQNNISRCWGLYYPLAELLGLTPSTDGSGGFKRRGVLQSMGALKRAREEELDTPLKKSRSDDPSPSSSNISEGPRIISQDEFRSLTDAPATRRPRRRGILKRILTDAEKEEQRDFERRRPPQKEFGMTLFRGHGRHSPSAFTIPGETMLNAWIQKVRHEAAPLPIECPDPELVRPKAPFRAHSVPWGGSKGPRQKSHIRRFDIGARRYAVAVKLSRESISGSMSGSPYDASDSCELLGSRSDRHCGELYLRNQSEPPQGSYTVDFIERTALRNEEDIHRASVEGMVMVPEPCEVSSAMSFGVMGSLRLMVASLLPTRWL